MTLQKRIKLLVIFIFVIIDIAIIYEDGYTLNDIFDWEIYLRLILIPSFFIFIPVVFSLLISSIIKGQLIRKNFQQILLWALIPSLVWGLSFIFNRGNQQYIDYQESNILHNENYKNFYNDDRDKNVVLAIEAIENKFSEKGEYKIKRMRVVELDTMIEGISKKFYDIHQIYCLGKECDENNTFAARHIILDNYINELYYNESIKNRIGSLENTICDSLMKKTLTNQIIDSLKMNTENFILDIVKLKE